MKRLLIHGFEHNGYSGFKASVKWDEVNTLSSEGNE